MPRSIPTPPEYAQHPELALVSLLYMLSRQHATGCRTMAESITAHFRFVAGDTRYADVLRNAAERLGMEWQGLLDATDHDGSVH
ncbi:MAG: hypothetical protein B7Y26_04780 [Hydrogenophilales bacterium 16-64-46]|nr:MAG: hypothetical protein B7Z32_04410 [Hydrogenophilales bacterium 12-64-13]OYZ06286.1 MAG: hypothetical protein B7Y26_04780 [Hydrogenophilales bacterium 16-64-46]OZA38815.1 MAG: hypothetical protein B7X87_05110 [Hydrogenophilales bacterium 17-64-34]HQS99553.1 hypothetical protein [Thiobacillus sp.]